MRAGIIGLGDIAQKAYLPIITRRRNLDLVFCTRNTNVLEELAEEYRIYEKANSVDELLTKNIEVAFVHAATGAHVKIVKKLLMNDVDVYVDKPLSFSYEEAKELVELAGQKQRKLMLGFNRRFAPMYAKLKRFKDPEIIIMEKNRVHNLDKPRRFIFNDFIHVVDTLRFLIPGEIKDISVRYLKREEELYHVILELIGEDFTAMGIMNRDSGVTEEKLELMNSGNKVVVKNLDQTLHFQNNRQEIENFRGWDETLYRRGFYQMIDSFLNSIKKNEELAITAEDALLTHQLCERVVKIIDNES